MEIPNPNYPLPLIISRMINNWFIKWIYMYYSINNDKLNDIMLYLTWLIKILID